MLIILALPIFLVPLNCKLIIKAKNYVIFNQKKTTSMIIVSKFTPYSLLNVTKSSLIT